jgi:hypothetical protein
MTAWRRSLPAYRRSALPAGPVSGAPDASGEPVRPWVPGEPDGPTAEGFPQPVPPVPAQPAGAARPVPPGAMPVVVSEWELTEDGDGAVKARPRLLSVPRAAVTVKDDDAPARERVRRFVEAWRWLIAARTQIQSAGLSADESDRYLAGAGVLVRIVPPSAARRARRRL